MAVLAPLRLQARTAKALARLSAHWQDALVRRADMAWLPERRQFVVLGERFCWEAERSWRFGHWRRRSLLQIRGAQAVQQRAMPPAEAWFNVLALLWEAGEKPSGRLRVMFAGGAELRLELEALDLMMRDVGEARRSWRRPRHDLGKQR